MSLERLLAQLADPSELSWKDETYDLALAGDLPATERSTFVAKLIEQAREGDTRAILTLGHLKASEALFVLNAAAKGQDPWSPTARRALVLFGRGADVANEIAHDAVHGPSKMGRIAAILDLPRIGGDIALVALQEALTDDDSDVRVLAWDALVEVLGLARRIQNPEGVRQLTTEIEVMRVLLASEIAALVKLGSSGMREVVRRLAAGATAQQLGIAWRPRQSEAVFENLRRAMFEPDIPYPVKELATLRGAARQLAETMIVRRLEEWDVRVPDILIVLDAAWTAPALEELAASASTPEDLRPKLADAARALATT